jgi:hypothetical protein
VARLEHAYPDCPNPSQEFTVDAWSVPAGAAYPVRRRPRQHNAA